MKGKQKNKGGGGGLKKEKKHSYIFFPNFFSQKRDTKAQQILIDSGMILRG